MKLVNTSEVHAAIDALSRTSSGAYADITQSEPLYALIDLQAAISSADTHERHSLLCMAIGRLRNAALELEKRMPPCSLNETD